MEPMKEKPNLDDIESTIKDGLFMVEHEQKNKKKFL